MKIVIAIDSFKGSLTSQEVAEATAESIHTHFPACAIESIPIADGGEGTLSVLAQNENTSPYSVMVHNPCMEIIPAQYVIAQDGETAFIEMANASGLPLIAPTQRNPMETTSFGTGELIKDALDKGCTRFIVGIGGSATNDAGTGLLQALGFRFLDIHGNKLSTGGKILERIARIDSSRKHPSLKNAHFIVACDVRNPFYGPNGAAHIYARQKGADDKMIAKLDQGMQSFANLILKETGKDIAQLPGSGAAGGIGGGMAALLNAELKPGADILLERVRFQEKIADADLIITGEGRMDRQSLMGKIPGKILQAGLEKGIPVIAIVGCAEDLETLSKAGFKGIYTTKPDLMPLEEAMRPNIAKQNVQQTVSKYLTQIINCG